MRKIITINDIRANIPEAIKYFEEKKSKSKSPLATTPLSDFKIYIEWGEEIKGYNTTEETFHQFIDEIMHNNTIKNILPTEQSLEERYKSVVGASITAINNRLHYTYVCDGLKDNSLVKDTILNHFQKLKDEDEAENNRIDLLTDEEKEKELQENVKQLRKMGGFSVVRL